MNAAYNREFLQKLTLLLIDKLLIGGCLVLAGWFVQSTLEHQRAALGQQQIERDRLVAERERVRDATIAVSRVLTEFVTVHRETIVTAVRNLIAMLNDYEGIGQVRELDDLERLEGIVEDIENAMEQLATANPDLPVVGDPFVLLIRRIRADLVNRTRDREALQADANELLSSYTTVLRELRRTSVVAMEDDRRAVSEILASQNAMELSR